MNELTIISLAAIVASVAIVAIVFGRGFKSRINPKGIKLDVDKS
jgi:hypothetical protein